MTSLDFVTPDLFGASGGIARIARSMVLALGRWADERGVALTVRALRDQEGRRQIRYLPEPHGYVTYDEQRARLAAAVLRSAWRGGAPVPRTVVFAHPNLAALCLGLPPWVKTAVVAHGVDVWSPLRLERRAALRRADACWPVSEDTARHLVVDQGVRRERITTIPNALDPFWPLPERPARGAAHLLAVSRLDPAHGYKGIDLTLEALAKMPRAERPPFVVAGDGPDRPRLEGLALGLGVDARFVGHTPDAALAELYRDAAAFVLPSTGEGFGLVYLEAMAFALPCIAARAGGAPEVVIDGVTGVVVPPGDRPALSAAIARVMGPDGERLGRQGRARLEREHLYPAYQARVFAAMDALTGRATGALMHRAR